VLFLHDLTRANAIDYHSRRRSDHAGSGRKTARKPPVIDVWNKRDARPWRRGGAHRRPGLSCQTGEGLEALRQRLLEVAGWQAAPEGLYCAGAPRAGAASAWMVTWTGGTAHLAAQAQALDLLAEELRLAQNALE
jgi:tRNA modification GTPase